MKNLRLKLSSADDGILDRALTDLIDLLKNNGVAFIGPIPLPTGYSSFRPCNGDVTHRRLIDIVDVQGKAEVLPVLVHSFNLPIGVSATMRYA